MAVDMILGVNGRRRRASNSQFPNYTRESPVCRKAFARM
jgi:hypothetical protein